MRGSFMIVAVAGLACVASADITDLRVTEIFNGQPDGNGTSDWFELTNTGATSVSTSGLFYDDNSFDPTVNDALDALTLAAGESVVFLVSWEDDFATAGDAIATFAAFWGVGSSVQVGTVTDGSGLGGGGDAVAIFDGNTGGASLLTSASYDGTTASMRGTSDYAAVAASVALRTPMDAVESTLAMPWVFESVGIANDPTDPRTLFGSPGAVPAPAAAGLLGFAGLAAARRRR